MRNNIVLIKNRVIVLDNIYYIPLSTTLFSAGRVCCLGRHFSAHVCHLQVLYLVTLFYHVLSINFHVNRVDPSVGYTLYILCTIMGWIFISWFNTVIILLELQILDVLCKFAAQNMLCLSTSHVSLFYSSS
jgi:hypothetical protein